MRNKLFGRNKPANPAKKAYASDGQDRLLPKLSLFIYDHARTAAILWVCLTLFGVLSYTVFMKREGFPSIAIPITVISGTYLVNDPAKVDREVAKPISDIVLADDRVQSVQSSARGSFYTLITQYREGVDADQAGRDLEQRIEREANLPAQASLKIEAPQFGFTERGDDAVISVYLENKGFTTEALVVEAESLIDSIRSKNIADVEAISIIDPYTTGTDPATGKQVITQTNFDRYGERSSEGSGSKTAFYQSVAVGIMQREGSDVIKLDDQLRQAVADYNNRRQDSGFRAVVSASFATDIKDQIGELQKALLEGLLAVLIVGSIVIAIRASLITVLSMLTVLAITVAVLFVVGYTLNTITLFALILCLGLIVDDTIIMVEAIDARRRRYKDPRETIKTATRKVSRAMVAATLTAALSFAPLLFVGGILGGFIRAIPVTVITSLLVSLAVALIFIPLFARYLLLGKKQMGPKNVKEPVSRIEARIAAFISRPMVWARHSRHKLVGVGLVAVVIGFGFIGAGGYLFQKVTFNIFPPSKDTNGLIMELRFAPGTTIANAQVTADRAQQILGDTLGDNFKTASYFADANEQAARMAINIIPYSERDIRAPQLEAQLETAFKDFQGAQVDIALADVGPPASDFSVQIATDDRAAAFKLAQDLQVFLQDRQLNRPSGEKATVTEVTLADPGVYQRSDGASFVAVTAGFDSTDTTTLVTLAQNAVKAEFDAEKLQTYGLPADALDYDIGQEQENQDSFKSLAIAFPVLLLVIYLLLAVQFRSLAQPLLIFMAIPFSLFGITLGLYLSDNAFSFFAMLGFFAIIGLSIKNTILLTDYANQLRRDGAGAVDAAVGALAERFRPLIATSLTAVVSLIPLALTSPFWEGLAIVLIGGLLSSTFLVVMVFPYYYLGAEYLRMKFSRTVVFVWLLLSAALVTVVVRTGAPLALVPLALVAAAILVGFAAKLRASRQQV